jgi:pimeloyl-ACP methyl ester carboxylesterase
MAAAPRNAVQSLGNLCIAPSEDVITFSGPIFQTIASLKAQGSRHVRSIPTTDDGVRLFFQTLGAGEQTVVIPNAVYMYDDFHRLARGRRFIAYDLRNRGRSDSVIDGARLSRGVHQDVDDLEAIRRHFAIEQMDLIGHFYLGVVVALYAMKHPLHVRRVIQIGPAQPDFSKQYPAHLTGADATSAQIFMKIGQLLREPQSGDPLERCERFWSVLRPMYVANRTDIDRLKRWGFCDLPNERNMLQHFNTNILPTLTSLKLSADEVRRRRCRFL